MPWRDLVSSVVDAGDLAFGSASDNYSGPAPTPVTAGVLTELYGSCDPYVSHWPPEVDLPSIELGGNCSLAMLINAGGESYWREWNASYRAARIDGMGAIEPLVGKQVRIRACMYRTSPGDSPPEAPQQLRLGVIWYDNSGGGIEMGHTAANLGPMAFSTYNEWSSWFEFTMTQGMASPPADTYVGIGGMVPYQADTGTSVEALLLQVQVFEEDGPEPEPDECITAYNCACETDDYPTATLLTMRTRLARRLGFGAQLPNLPPGVGPLLDDFLHSAQEQVYQELGAPQLERFFTWPLIPGVRFYDLAENAEECTKRLNPLEVTWAGVSRCCHDWTPLDCGIPPELYECGRSGSPERYEIRQCIEVWPTPADTGHFLRIKGRFGLLPFAADADVTTVDPELLFLLALANAKADRGHQDAGNYMQLYQRRLGDLRAKSHGTRRYLPGQAVDGPRPYRVGRTGRW